MGNENFFNKLVFYIWIYMKNVNFHLTVYIKINLRYMQDPNLLAKFMKFLE